MNSVLFVPKRVTGSQYSSCHHPPTSKAKKSKNEEKGSTYLGDRQNGGGAKLPKQPGEVPQSPANLFALFSAVKKEGGVGQEKNRGSHFWGGGKKGQEQTLHATSQKVWRKLYMAKRSTHYQ